MNQKDSQTQKNLSTAFLREAGAFLEYSFYAKQAEAEGLKDIALTFTRFAHNEQAHAEVWFKLYHGISNTQSNLNDSADLEKFERTVLYKEFSKTALEEGFTDIAKLFDGVSEVEGAHETEYRNLFNLLKNDKLFKSKSKTAYICLNCGHIHYGTSAPETCPICSHPQTFFKKQEQ